MWGLSYADVRCFSPLLRANIARTNIIISARRRHRVTEQTDCRRMLDDRGSHDNSHIEARKPPVARASGELAWSPVIVFDALRSLALSSPPFPLR